MTGFVKQKITNSQSLGSMLREAREEKGVDLEKASKDIKISFKYLSALENNKLSDIPGETYLKNFLKAYCDFLDLKYSECWKMAKKLQIKNIEQKQGLDKKNFFVWSKWLKNILILAIILAVLVFLIFKVQEIFSPPKLEIINPKDDSVVTERQIDLVGISEPEVELRINNRNVFVDDEGNFRTTLDLQKGLNLIKITAKKRYSQSREAELRVLLTEIR